MLKEMFYYVLLKEKKINIPVQNKMKSPFLNTHREQGMEIQPN
jgi:hypothetical protein